MKAKLERGSGFRGALDYALGKGPACEIVGGNMSGGTARALAAEFGLSRQVRSEVKRPVWHTSLSLPTGDSLDPDRWAAVTADFMDRMGLGDHQYVVVRHRDTDHDHVHIVASRIGLDGGLYHGEWDAKRAIQVTQELEKAHGLTRTKGLEGGKAAQSRPTQGEIEQMDRTGEAPVRMRLQEIIDAALDGEPKTLMAFIDQMESAGVTALPNVATTGRMNGFSFELDGIAFKASQLGKAYGWKSLQERGIDYVQDRDGQELIARADEIKRRIAEVSGGSPAGAGAEVGPAGDGLVDDLSEVRRLPGGDGADAPNGDRSRREDLVPGSEIDPLHNEGSSDLTPAGREVPAGVAGSGGADGRADLDAVADRIADLAAPAPEPSLQHGRPLPLTEAQKAKARAWEVQSRALAAPEYRITLTARRPELSTYNLGKPKNDDESERFYSPEAVRDLIPYLSRKNLLGYDIYITPIDKAQHFILVDDTTPEKVEDMRARGFAPALVQQSSEGNVQAVLRLPRRDERQEQKAANLLMGMLNKEWGDPKISGVIHAFRMAGFSNKKPGRGDVFTRVIDAAGVICGKATDMLESARQKLRDTLQARKQKASPKVMERRSVDALPAPDGAAEARFDALRKREVGLAKSKGWTLNDSALDFRAAKIMAQEGWEADEIAAAIVARSPNVVDRHKDPVGYATLTAENASTIERADREAPEGEQPPQADDRPEGPG
jgi:hypothetical protein